jgi:hypothetical protein
MSNSNFTWIVPSSSAAVVEDEDVQLRHRNALSSSVTSLALYGSIMAIETYHIDQHLLVLTGRLIDDEERLLMMMMIC